MSKILHIFSDSPYAVKFIELINKNFDVTEHSFLILSLKKDSKFLADYQSFKNCELVFSKHLYWHNKGKFELSEQIIVHQLNKPALMASLLLLYPAAFKKMVWVLWGGDVYINAIEQRNFKDRLLEELRCVVIKKVPIMVSYLKGDYEHVVKSYNTKAQYFKADYPSFITERQVKQLQIESKIGSSTLIVVGNSADPSNEHIDVYHLLEKYKNENIKVVSLLSYGGSKAYIDMVKCEGESIFGDKYHPIESYMNFDEYLSFMSDSDICIFNHKRQQGLGNLKVFFALQKKVFISQTTSPYEYFQSIGLAVNSTESLLDCSFSEFVSQSESTSKKNRDIMLNEINEKNIVSDWQQVFNKAIK